MAVARRKRLLLYLLAALLVGVAPLLTLMWMAHHRAISRSENMLGEAAKAATTRIDRLLGDADVALADLAHHTAGRMDERTAGLLQRAVYNLRSFREAGLIDERANLVCTSLGPVDPPVFILPHKRSDPARHRMQIVGLVDTEVMKRTSLILALPTIGAGEVNLLMDPAVLTEVFEPFVLGPGGFALVTAANGRPLARFGAPTTTQPAAVGDAAGGAEAGVADPHGFIVVTRETDRFGVRVSVRIARAWALREWYADLRWMIPLGIAFSALIALVAILLAARPASVQDDLRLALRRGEFEAHYQPIIELASDRCIGAEALLRWRHPVDGLVRPDVFIGVAEDSGLIEPLTEWLVDRVAKDLGDTLRSRQDLHIGVNLAPSHFDSPSIVATLSRILRPYQLPVNRLMLEATERGMIGDDVGVSRSVINDLRALGARIAIDDFGTGYSSLAYLHTFKFDALKIDASFVRRIGTGALSAAMIDTIIDLGHTLHVRIIAEGVETPHQAEYLKQRGVHAAQGWLYAKAMPAAEFLDFVRKNA